MNDKTIIKILVAYANNGVIGKDNTLPWHIPEDLKRFKSLTEKEIVIMGRKTFDSLPTKPLPNRLNIVLTKSDIPTYSIENLIFFNDFTNTLGYIRANHNNRVCYVIGGESIYKQFLSFTDEILATEIHKEINGDTFFPTLSNRIWNEVEKIKNEGIEFDYDYVTYKRF